MATINLSNYTTSLAQSTVGRTGTPDGNVFFDVTNGRLEIITAEELTALDLTAKGTGTSGVLATAMTARAYVIATVGSTDFTSFGAASNTVGLLFTSSGAGTGTGTVNEATANPLNEDEGIRMEALYAFERQERRIDETLRQYDYFFTGTFKFGGAYNIVNNRKFDDGDGSATSQTTDDRFKIRGSGWIELDAAGAIGRIYYGNSSLGNIEAASQPYYQLSDGGVPVNYDKDGPINEAVQVFGDIAVDSNTTTFDTRTYESLKIRTFGNNYDEKILSDSGVSEMGGYSTGFALSESVHLTTGNYTLADVYGGAQIAPWTGMGLEELDVAQTETGFTTADGDFTWVLNNSGSGTLDECIAFLDAIAQTDDDINDHGTNVTNGKRVGVWYGYNAAGKILPSVNTGATGEGLFIESLTGTDKNRVIFTDDAGASKEYPAFSNVVVTVGANAVADTNAWFHSFFLDGPASNDFNTSTALTVEDADGSTLIKGNVNGSGLRTVNDIVFEFDHTGDTIGGTAGTDKDIVFECEGDGGVTQAKTVFTLTNAASITASCIPLPETNV